MKIDLDYRPKEYCEFAKAEIEFLFEVARRYHNALNLEINMVGEYIIGTFEGSSTDLYQILCRTCEGNSAIIETPIDDVSSKYTITVTHFSRD